MSSGQMLWSDRLHPNSSRNVIRGSDLSGMVDESTTTHFLVSSLSKSLIVAMLLPVASQWDIKTAGVNGTSVCLPGTWKCVGHNGFQSRCTPPPCAAHGAGAMPPPFATWVFLVALMRKSFFHTDCKAGLERKSFPNFLRWS